MNSIQLEALKAKYDYIDPASKIILKLLISKGLMPKTIARRVGCSRAGQQDIQQAASYLLQLKRIDAL